MLKLLIWLFFAIVVIPISIAKNPFESFIGSYHLDSAPIMDSDFPLQADTHAYINIEGEAAKKIYDAMTVKPYENRCGEDHLSKDAGNFTCAYYPASKKYFCYFSIDINNGKLDGVGSC